MIVAPRVFTCLFFIVLACCAGKSSLCHPLFYFLTLFRLCLLPSRPSLLLLPRRLAFAKDFPPISPTTPIPHNCESRGLMHEAQPVSDYLSAPPTRSVPSLTSFRPSHTPESIPGPRTRTSYSSPVAVFYIGGRVLPFRERGTRTASRFGAPGGVNAESFTGARGDGVRCGIDGGGTRFCAQGRRR